MTEPTHAHEQAITNRYAILYPEHPARTSDPHYRDFHHYHETTKHNPDIYQCAWAKEVGDKTECAPGPLELHHSHVEFALQNGVDLAHLEHAYPGVSDPDEVGAWVESAANLIWLCAFHHRAAAGGIHHLAAADYEASKWLKAGIITTAPAPAPHHGTDTNPR
jgi:hypothetical protein